MEGNDVTPAPAAAEVRQLDIWLSPYGFLKAAMAATDLTAAAMTLGGRRALSNAYPDPDRPTMPQKCCKQLFCATFV